MPYPGTPITGDQRRTAVEGDRLDPAKLVRCSIGQPDTRVLFAGARRDYESCETLLRCLGGDISYLGENPAAAAAIDMALLTEAITRQIGALHGAAVCESEGVDIGLYAGMFPEGDRARRVLPPVQDGAFDNPGATLAVWGEAVERILKQAHDAGLAKDLPIFLSELFRRGTAEGLGGADIAALIELLREGAARESRHGTFGERPRRPPD